MEISMLKTLLEDLYLSDAEIDKKIDDLKYYSKNYGDKIMNVRGDILNLISSINKYGIK